MIVTTTENLPGKRITRVLGLVRGNTIRARHIGRDILAGLRNIAGGEVKEYTTLLADTRYALRQYARRRGPSIRDDGMRRVLAGNTTLEEVLRVTRSD